MCGGCVAINEASQAPAAFAAGFVFVGTAAWAKAKSVFDRSKRSRDDELEPTEPEGGSAHSAEPNGERVDTCADLVDAVHDG